MPRRTKRPADPILAELYDLADETAVLPSTLARCTTILELLPERLVGSNSDPLDKAAALKRFMFEILDDAFTAREADSDDTFAGMILAAGAVMGLVPETPDLPPTGKPSEMMAKASQSKEIRQTYAGRWLVPPVGWDQFRKPKGGKPSKESQSLGTFRQAILSALGIESGEKPSGVSRLSHSRQLSGGPGSSCVDEELQGANQSPSNRRGWPSVPGRAVVISVVVAGAAVALVLSLTIGDSDINGNSPSSTTTTAMPQSPASSASAQVHTLTFDALGGQPPIIRVFPGVTDSVQDRTHNGTFNDGDAVSAICKTKGRTVSSDPAAGDAPRTSDMWIRIEGSPGLAQYATATYAKDHEKLLKELPNC